MGVLPCVPKSSTVSTSPTPKYCAQKRLTATRAVSGLAGSTSHFASARRLGGCPAAAVSGLQDRRNAGRDHFTRVEKVAAGENVRFARRRQLLHYQRCDALFR